jgi:hypothetical protein
MSGSDNCNQVIKKLKTSVLILKPENKTKLGKTLKTKDHDNVERITLK